MKKDFTGLYCKVDDFVKDLSNNFIAINNRKSKAGRKTSLSLSETLTILISFYESSYDCFKHYYKEVILVEHQDDFKLVSYEHFTRLIGKALPYLTLVLNNLLVKCDGNSFIDSTSIAVCKDYRIYSHKVFKNFASRTKTTKGWYYGLKLHLIINLQGELIKVSFSSGNKDDRKHLSKMTQGIFGKLCGDRGYISKKLFQDLWAEGIELITGIKRKMKNYLMPFINKIMLLKRVLVESVISRIKLLEKFEHSRHRSPVNAFSHMIACLINYQLLPDKPSIKNLFQLE